MNRLKNFESMPGTSPAMLHTIKDHALQWTDGHILGNGDVGAVVWGYPGNVIIGLSKHDVNDLRQNPKNEGWPLNYMQIRAKVIDGHRAIDDLITFHGEDKLKGPYQISCGQLSIEFRGTQMVAYSQTLDMRTASCRCSCEPTPAAKNWGMKHAPVEITSFVHAESNILVVDLHSDLEQTVLWKYDYSPNLELPSPPCYKFDCRSGIGLVRHELPEMQSYTVALHAEASESRTSASQLGLHGTLRFGGKCGGARILVSIASKHDAGQNANPSELALKILKTARGMGLVGLRAGHEKWWAYFWDRSEIRHYDEEIARLWYFGVYALGSSTRPDKSPPNLQGIWNQYDVPPWKADFHFNANIQECHWIACPSNHPELQSALVRVLVHDWRPLYRRYASEIFGARGMALPLCGDWLGRAIGWGGLSLEISLTAWMAQHVWRQWLFTQDRSLLEKEVYPFLKEACEFYIDILHRRSDGLYHVELSQSPEQVAFDKNGKVCLSYGSDPTIDLVFIEELFRSFIEASRELGTEGDFSDLVKDVLGHLPALPTADGVLIDYAVGYFKEGDRPGRFPESHRHPSRLAGIFPGEAIGLHSPMETLELGRRSFREYLSYGDDGFTGWSLAWQAGLAARLGLPDEAEKRLRILLDNFTLKGMLNSHNSITGHHGFAGGALFQIEGSLGAAAAVNEMFLQSTGGIIRVFPAVREKRKAAFRNLRAAGAVLVSAEQDESGVVFVEVISATDRLLTLANPWPKRQVALERGDCICHAEGEQIKISAHQSEKIRLRPA